LYLAVKRKPLASGKYGATPMGPNRSTGRGPIRLGARSIQAVVVLRAGERGSGPPVRGRPVSVRADFLPNRRQSWSQARFVAHLALDDPSSVPGDRPAVSSNRGARRSAGMGNRGKSGNLGRSIRVVRSGGSERTPQPWDFGASRGSPGVPSRGPSCHPADANFVARGTMSIALSLEGVLARTAKSLPSLRSCRAGFVLSKV